MLFRSNKAHSPSDLKKTDAGRPVYSGGGIEPDRYLAGPIEGFSPTAFGRSLYGRQVFQKYAQKFTAEGDTRVAQPSTGRRTVSAEFAVDDSMVAELRAQLMEDKIKIDEDAWAKDLPFIKAMIRFAIDETDFGLSTARRHLISVDPQAQLALSLFGEAQRLTELRKTPQKPAN